MNLFTFIASSAYIQHSKKLLTIFILSICLFSIESKAQVASLYTFSTSAGTYTTITGGTQLYVTTFDDGVSSAVTIPSFNFNGTAYTSIRISTNGFITFGTTAPNTTDYTPISGSTGYSGAVSAFAYDLNNAATGTPEIRYQTVGSEFIIQWQDVRRYNIASERISCQIRLNTSTNAISIVYGGTITPGSSANYLQVGLRGTANTDYNNRTVAGAWSGTTAGTANNNTCYFNSAQTGYVPVTGRTFTWSRLVSTTLNNTSASGTVQTAYNNVYWNTTKPVFTLSADNSANRFFIELNTKADFTGTSYTQTFTGTYTASTKYDLTCNSLSTALPSTAATYFVRAKASSDAGSTWGAYTSTTWVFSKSTSIFGYHYTASTQFNQGTLVSTNYGNFITANSNGTTTTETDDYMEVNQGTNTSTMTASDDHYITENVSNYGGASYTYLTVGAAYYSSAQQTDYVGFRFQNFALPQGATVQSAYLNAYATSSGPYPNLTNNLYLKVRAAAADNSSAWANSTNTSTGDPKDRTRSTTALDWDITAAWTDGLLVTSPDISTVLQDVISRAGYASGNAVSFILDYDGTAVTSANRHRYFSTPSRGAGYKPYLTTTFTNFSNTIQFTNIALANAYGATTWDQLIFDVDKASCGACDVTFEVRKTSDNSLIATGNTSPISLGSSTASNVYVVVIMKRNSSPLMHSFTLTTNAVVALPVELTSFTGRKVGKNNELQWVTESEINNDYFTIEKTTDGIYFETVGNENGAGTSSQYLTYTMVDEHVKSEINYYRLRQTDFDGKYNYMPMISIDNRVQASSKEIVRIINVYGQEVDEHYKGVVIIVYSDNTVYRTVQNL